MGNVRLSSSQIRLSGRNADGHTSSLPRQSPSAPRATPCRSRCAPRGRARSRRAAMTAEPLGRTSRSAASAHAAVTTRSRRRIVRGPTGAASPPRRLRPQVDSPPIAVEFSPASIAVARRALLLEVHSAGSTIPWQPSCDKQQWAASPAEAVDELGRGLCGVNVPIIQCAQLLDPLNIWAQQTLTGRTAAAAESGGPGFCSGFSRPRAAHRNFYAPRKAYVF